MYTSLKNYFYEHSNRKYGIEYVDVELASMEDIIPVFIIIVLFSNLPNIKLHLTMMVDYLNQHDEDFDGEGRAIINLSVILA